MHGDVSRWSSDGHDRKKNSGVASVDRLPKICEDSRDVAKCGTCKGSCQESSNEQASKRRSECAEEIESKVVDEGDVEDVPTAILNPISVRSQCEVMEIVQYSESGAQNSGPKQYPKRKHVVTRFATRVDTWKCSEMLGMHPVGLLEANVAFVTRMIAAIVIYLADKLAFRGENCYSWVCIPSSTFAPLPNDPQC